MINCIKVILMLKLMMLSILMLLMLLKIFMLDKRKNIEVYQIDVLFLLQKSLQEKNEIFAMPMSLLKMLH